MANFSQEQLFVVTGASSGIGAAVSLALNRMGASVVLVARDLPRLEAVKNSAAHPELMFVEQKDLADDIENLPRYVQQLCTRYGKLQGIAYCAGATEVRPLRAIDLGDMHKIFAINYFAPIFMAKGFADRRVSKGDRACFVAIASIASVNPAKATITYSGSKAALVTSFKAIAKEFAESGVRFNIVSPSDIETPMTESIADVMQNVRDRYPLGFGNPNDVAGMVTFLLSTEAKWITGQNYIVDCCSF